ncbi:MAG: hypothetical protein LBD44_01840 [Spirochaetaceae bacterium]|jgi:hypothetical protein|nr:hypothetical protein [Spirochaetaceae bacterium]
MLENAARRYPLPKLSCIRRVSEKPAAQLVRVKPIAAQAHEIAGILKDFFENLSPDELNMLTAEWNLGDAIKVACEESWENGWEKGIEKERELFSSNRFFAGLFNSCLYVQAPR